MTREREGPIGTRRWEGEGDAIGYSYSLWHPLIRPPILGASAPGGPPSPASSRSDAAHGMSFKISPITLLWCRMAMVPFRVR